MKYREGLPHRNQNQPEPEQPRDQDPEGPLRWQPPGPSDDETRGPQATHVNQCGIPLPSKRERPRWPAPHNDRAHKCTRCGIPSPSKRERPRWPAARDDREYKWRAQPTALRIISALPDCNTLLYCCQANRITSERSASSRPSPQERTNATVSSAGRPPASKISGTSSPPEGG